MTTHHCARRIRDEFIVSCISHLADPERPARLKLVFAKVALDLPFPVPYGAGARVADVRG